jgi:hypothetical protein
MKREASRASTTLQVSFSAFFLDFPASPHSSERSSCPFRRFHLNSMHGIDEKPAGK